MKSLILVGILVQVVIYYSVLYFNRKKCTNLSLVIGLFCLIPAAGTLALLWQAIALGGVEKISNWLNTPLGKKNIWKVKEFKEYNFLIREGYMFKSQKVALEAEAAFFVETDFSFFDEYLETLDYVLKVPNISDYYIPSESRP